MNANRWIDEMVQYTHGWPYHITSYGQSASDDLKNNT